MKTPDTPCALTVEFQVGTADFATFLEAVRENAALSVLKEPGCLRFDVLVPVGEAPSVLLYEIYRNRADFDLHLTTEHYLHFDAAIRGMVRGKKVVFHHLTEHAKALP